MDWRIFWRQISTNIYQVKMDQTTLDPLIPCEVQELCMTGPIHIKVICEVLRLIERMEHRSLKKLRFDKVKFKKDTTFILAKSLRLVSSSVKCVVFTNCVFARSKVVDTIMKACTGMTHILFSESKFHPSKRKLTKPRQKDVIVPADPFSSLTYLKIASSYSNVGCYDCQQLTGRLSGVLQQCPNLVHLFLDSGLSVYQGHCIKSTAKYCPQLQNLIVSDNAEMPETVTTYIEEDEYYSPDKEEPPKRIQVIRLRRFVFMAGLDSYEPDDIISAYTTTHETLELLYLQHCKSATLLKLARHHASNLREVCLTMKSEVSHILERSPPIDLALASLFSSCPALEAIKIGDRYSTGGPDALYTHYIYANDTVLKAIADNCENLRHLKVVSRRHHTSKGMLYFAKVGGSKLTYLEIDTDQTIVLLLVKTLKSLQRLRIRNDSIFTVNTTPITAYDMINAKRILQERDGSLTFDL